MLFASGIGALRILSFDPDIALESVRLPDLGHTDPADRFIIATARVLSCKLMTHDHTLIAYAEQGYVNVVEK